MIDQPPFPLVPKETLPIDSADIYEDERGGYAFGRGNFRATYSSQAVNIPACAAYDSVGPTQPFWQGGQGESLSQGRPGRVRIRRSED